ncbi:hypothetical protein HBI56_200460 [Parastagonospora nodorum]|uniref:Uncharacterized protein n=1 Tax=Phaeosphaeria nodorum (strain SN15 / ATCC MYA-4574 / FGSC 10173) TaxID=321614 RepID=A0A7U2HXB7_PHANO|nr:hypothetical protein HBH56_215000 [Parastagonospora nodorum]QRC93809.1 hypothetical protein JI435_404550 [Parastagonospora nodorum SN15]KAH3922614.1 hypothetical protein HBH54_222500 [Parastagonospora nodorum]KAH3942205.1 hypothetical protein HBH53_192410 [Parastagonospora nodorum]KAH3961310.1 hypothetical protein HBH51_183690 [Parastagonospora nodorum]
MRHPCATGDRAKIDFFHALALPTKSFPADAALQPQGNVRARRACLKISPLLLLVASNGSLLTLNGMAQ